MTSRWIDSAIALRASLCWKIGCCVLGSERAPSTSVFGSAKLTMMRSALAPGPVVTTPAPPAAIWSSTAGSTCTFQAQSASAEASTARAAPAESPPPFISTESKYGLPGSQ
jgi:hypothetical protein